MIKFLKIPDANADVEDIINNINDYVMLNRKDRISISSSQYNIDDAINRLGRGLFTVNQTYNISTNSNINSSRKYFGGIVRFIKRVMRKSIKWYIDDIMRQQVEHNASVTRYLNEANYLIQYLSEQNKELQSSIYEREKEIKELMLNIENQVNYKISNLDKSIKKYHHPLDKDKVLLKEQFYLDFENNFRGNEDLIKKRLISYLPYFIGKETVVDIGCGRGEFLELLQNNGINAIGVDINSKMIEQCKEKGLNVVLRDGTSYLNTLEDASLDGVIACQLVEHLSDEQLENFLDVCEKKLKKGGCLVLETINPLTLSVFSYSFYLDPTHIKPVHPATLRFTVERKGFDVKPIQFLNQFPDDYKLEIKEDMDEVLKNNIKRLNDALYGAQDYAIICERR